MQVAKEHHQLLLARVNMAIEAGVEEARAFVSSLPAVSPEEAVNNGDLVRQKVLEQFENMEMRPAGSY
jgi:hypothetical protein